MLEVLLAYVCVGGLQDPAATVQRLRAETIARICGTIERGVLSTPTAIGDVNGDGVTDWAIASHEARMDDNGESRRTGGRVVIASGVSLVSLREISLGEGFQFMTTVTGAPSPYSITSLDDMDADGVSDFAVVGVRGGMSTVSIHSAKTGEVLIRASGGARSCDAVTMSRIGDLDGDNLADLVVGWPRVRTEGVEGGLGAVSSRSGKLLWELPGSPRVGQLGASVLGIPDINGDGAPDILVAAVPGSWTVGCELRNLEISKRNLLQCLSGIDGKPLWEVAGKAGEKYGMQMASLGDLDQDGVRDIAVVGGTSHDVRIDFLSGATGALIWSLGEPKAYGTLQLATCDDVDNDGERELIVGAEEGWKVTHGDFIGRGDMAVVSPTKRKVLVTVHGLMWSGFGSAVASGGNRTDGRVTVAVGSVNDFNCDKESSGSVELIALTWDDAVDAASEPAKR